MDYRRLGASGMKVSVVGLGSWLTMGGYVDEETAAETVRVAFERGVNFFDTADVYRLGQAEMVLGRALADIPRKDYVLASKCFFPTGDGPNDRGLSRKHVFESLHASLARLRTDYLDLYQCHRYDDETPLDETVAAMSDAIRQGKIHYWGVSMWEAAQIEHACELADSLGGYRPVSNQPVYNMLDRRIEEGVIEASERCGLSQVVYSPLGQGALTGKYSGGRRPTSTRGADAKNNVFMDRYLRPEALDAIDRIAALAEEIDTTPARFALAWCLRHRNVASAIVGARNVRQVEENVAAADVEIPAEILAKVEAILAAVPAGENGG